MWNLCASCLIVCLLRSTCVQSDIRKPPSITQGPSKQNFIYRSDDTVTLDCKGEGVPAVEYEWKKNGVALNPNLPNIDKGADGTITIRQAATSDEGFYQCFVKNQFGTALSNTAHLQRGLLDSGAGTPTTLPKTVVEGMPFHIQADPRKSFPKPTFGWEMATDAVDKNPVSLRPSKRIQIAENGDLHFAYALPEDALDGKIYKCTTYNAYLDVKAGGSYTQLTVTTSPSINPFQPTIGFASEAQTVAVIGGSATLRCFFYGYPEPTIAWSGPRNTLPIGRYTLAQFNTELTIKNITAADQGDYVCTASNTGGQNTHTLQIRVEEVPIFRNVKDGPDDINVTEGESLTFNCIVSAKPDAKIVWLQDGIELDAENPPRRFAFSNDRKRLTIRDVCRNCDDREKQTDLTVIQCNASNIHGYAFASGYLNVLSKTEVTIMEETEVTVNPDAEGRVEFDCRAASDPSTPPAIRWFKVDTNELVHSEPPFLTVNGGLLTIHVDASSAAIWWKYIGQYRCVVQTLHSSVNKTANIIAASVTQATLTAGMCGDLKVLGLEVCWVWVGIAAAVLGLFIVIVVICCAFCHRKKGDKYNIDKSERWTGRDPAKEFYDDGFQEYQRQECKTPTLLRPSYSNATLLKINEEDSLNEYMGDEGRFTEDGSFIGGTYRSQSRLDDSNRYC